MQFTTFSGAAVLLALAQGALSAGSAKVVNNCGFDVYYATVAQSVHAAMAKLPASGMSESFSLPNVGVSIKLSPTATGDVTQFEYTWDSPNIAYDISNINGNPFAEWGMELAPSVAASTAFPTCKTVSCPAGEKTCTAAYNLPDDTRTMVCGENTHLTMTLCPSGSSNYKRSEHVHGRVHARHLPKLN